MTCPQCGSDLSDIAAFCGACGGTIIRVEAQAGATEATGRSAEIERLARVTWNVLKAIAVNPVERVPKTFFEFQKLEALKTGLVLAGLFDLCTMIGLFFALPRWVGSPGFADILKFLLFGIVPPAAVTGAIALARKTFHGRNGTIESDVFVAGASLVPISVALLLSGLLGSASIDIMAILAVFAFVYTVLILYTGCTRISEIEIPRAIPAVPIIILIAAWLSKIIFAAMF